ncbi:Flp family type IVb pilin [Rhizobium sp. CSW-27]|uniref:Flp family type IVb pilin n=1 Tax=Rhizobium sp. CSW-27 TaxID=2839985 RepID=UPI002078BD49|nr:Flp family type IVb pilin [Rhizobium sp. CSW-27]
MPHLVRLLADRSGATAMEYGLIAALVCVALIAGLGTFTDSLQTSLAIVSDALTGH